MTDPIVSENRTQPPTALLEEHAGTEGFADLFNQMAQGVVYQDADGRVTLANPSAERILGLTLAQLQGRDSFDPRWRAIREDGCDMPGDAHPSMMALRTGKQVRDVVMGVFNPREGRYRWIEINAVPQYRPGECRPYRVFTTFDDVTRRHDAELALRRSEARFRAAAECSSDILYEWDPETNRLEYFGNTRLGLPEGEASSADTWIERLHPSERESMMAEVRRCMASGEAFSREHRVRMGDGQWLHLLTRGRAIDDGTGRLRWVGATTDETAKHRAIERVRETLNLFEAVVEGTSDAIFVKNLKGQYLFVNTAAAACLGVAAEEALGKSNHQLLSPDLATILESSDRAVIDSGTQITAESPGPSPGERRQFLMTKAPLRDAAGAIVGVIGVARDVTELKRLEEEYRQTQKMEAVGLLAGGVAHDFNNLLTVILGCAEDMLVEATGEQAGALTMIKSAAERAAELTSQLLAFSRRQVLQPRPTDPNRLVTNLERMLRRIIGEDIVLMSELSPCAGTVLVDPGQFEQVLVNLVVNARDAMPHGGHLTIETKNFDVDDVVLARHPSLPRGRHVMISVTDNGIGMTAETLSRIFEPFFTTKGGKGTGLGLATVHGIIKQSGGDVWAYSELGQGTTFNVILPRVDTVAETSAEQRREVAGGTESILVVDDEPSLRSLMQTALSRRGYRVTTCGDAAEALDWLRRHQGQIDLVITDLVMPKGSGQHIADALPYTHPKAKLLFMSGYADHAAFDLGKLSSESHFLQKPFTPAALCQKVRDILDT